MDKRIEWPWSLEEEAEWKSELAQREAESVDELTGDAAEDAPLGGRDAVGISGRSSADATFPEKYLVTT